MIITYEEWMDKFIPMMAPSGDRPLDMDPRVNESFTYKDLTDAVAARKVWTLVKEEGRQFLLQGYHFINCLEHYVCTNAYDPQYDYEIEMCDQCD